MRAMRRLISVLPTPVGPIIRIFLGIMSAWSPLSVICRRRQRFRREMATAFLASVWPTMKRSRISSIPRGLSASISSFVKKALLSGREAEAQAACVPMAEALSLVETRRNIVRGLFCFRCFPFVLMGRDRDEKQSPIPTSFFSSGYKVLCFSFLVKTRKKLTLWLSWRSCVIGSFLLDEMVDNRFGVVRVSNSKFNCRSTTKSTMNAEGPCVVRDGS